MRNDFVSFVTHQLRTPLSGIKWMLELATETDDAEEKASYVGDARESADRLIGLVNDLLDASRLESGKLQVTLEPVRLRQLTYDVLADVATLVREKNHELDIQCEGEMPIAMLDSQLLRQVKRRGEWARFDGCGTPSRPTGHKGVPNQPLSDIAASNDLEQRGRWAAIGWFSGRRACRLSFAPARQRRRPPFLPAKAV